MNENLISGYTKTIRIVVVKIRKLISLSGPQHLTKKSVSQKKTSIVCLVGRRGTLHPGNILFIGVTRFEDKNMYKTI